MSILSKVTLGFVIIAALCFTYVAMRTLKTHEAWRNAVQAHKTAIEKVEKDTVVKMEGDSEKGELSMGQLRVAMDTALHGRGRAWMDCSPRFDAASGNIVVTINQQQPHQIQQPMVLHAFQGLDDPATGRYIGEFNVAAADANTVTLSPCYTPTAVRRAIMQQARGPWALYEVIPADSNEQFASLGRDEIKALLPEEPQQIVGEVDDDFQARKIEHGKLVQEYTRNNKPIKPEELDPNDPLKPEQMVVVVKFLKDQADLTANAKADLQAMNFGENLVKSGVVMKVDFKTAEELVRLELVQEVERRYQRKLIDYSYILREFHRRLPIMEDHIVNLQKDLDYMIESNKVADSHQTESRKQELAMRQELALVEKERNVVSQFRDTLQGRLDKVNAEIARLQEDNRRLAAQLAQRQMQAVQAAGRSASTTAKAAGAR